MDPCARHQFLQEYATIRQAEGRGCGDPRFYRELPYRDITGRNAEQWSIRSRSYRYFERTMLSNVERRMGRPLDILDLGAGNGWMSYRLALRQHRVVALDIFHDEMDGLRALAHYPVPLPGVTAEFDSLPFRDASFDVAVFNSSFHYSSDYRRTLEAVRRSLRQPGWLVIMDSPLYRRPEHGEMMRAERQALFEKVHGFRSDALGSIEYLDWETLEQLSRELDIELEWREPWYGWRWALRPLAAKLRGRRPPSRFGIVTGRFRHR